MSETRETKSFAEFQRRLLLVVFVVLLMLTLLYYTSLLLLFFAAVLVSVIIQGIAQWTSERTKMGYGLSLLSTLLALTVLFSGLGVMIGAPFVAQIDELRVSMMAALADVREQFRDTVIGERLVAMAPDWNELMSRIPKDRLLGVFSGLVGAFSSIAIVAFIAIYLAINPDLYVNGFIAMVPKKRKERARDIIGLIAHALRYWMIGRVSAMFAVGLLTGLGLWIIGVPLPLSLGVLAGLFSFVPIVGPIVSAIPGILIAFSQSIAMAFYALAVYVGVQIIEGNVVTPLVQQRAVSLPPVLLLGAQTLAGVMIGIVGVIFATPLVVTLIVLVQTVYVQDTLGGEVLPLGQRPRRPTKHHEDAA